MSVIDHPPPSRWSAGQSINRQLHDVVVPQLFLLSTGLTALQRRQRSDADDALVDDLVAVAASAVADLRSISRGHSVGEGGDLVGVAKRLRTATDSLSRLTPCLVHVHVEGNGFVPPRLEDDLVAVLWEGTTNAIRHGRATEVEIELTAANGWLSLTVRDNGTWAWPADMASSGIRGLRDRAVHWGGDLVVEHDGESSTVLAFHVPLPGMTESPVEQ